ncbi:glycoside hydrolase family 13 protein [Anaerobranca gottschalkii]|uniref:Glycosidase n=1 Tax=Anaerobranca gottschalkii DSM 13577 TaxID=1120990 RepID=A0A1H9ZQC4_9FIRM|nr:glycoside hydrolase family 13 protein [Anaerobranca gottschalkii]SES83981.1 Glycosidase [Anaerobranca gottschalkii DSM 13577]
MLIQAIHHLPKNNYAFIVNDKEVEIRIQTGPEVKKVEIIYGDKYDWDSTVSQLDMTVLGRDELFTYWYCRLYCPAKRITYGFKVYGPDQVIWVKETGYTSEPIEGHRELFDFPWVHVSDALTISDWVRDAVFYQIFPDRFANGDTSNDPTNLTPWDSPPTPTSFYGGDLQGIIDKLDYLSELGINAIYLTPIFTAPSNHKYDTVDYKTIDPHFGDLSTLKKLVNACHNRGIKVILDAVFNHIGWYSPQFQDVLKHGNQSKFADWFNISDFPLRTHPNPNYECFGFVASMPKLNTTNPEVKEFLLDIAEYWIKEANIDGWRLDVANEIDHQFWRDFRRRVKAIKPDAYIVGEIMFFAGPWLQGDQFDGVMNYRLTEALIDYVAEGKIDSKEFTHQLNKVLFYYQRSAMLGNLNLLDSHDTPRFLTRCKGNKKLFKLAAMLMFSLPGAPCIYYGDEIGMEGGHDPDCRRGMIWNKAKQDGELLDWYRRLIAVRRNHPAFSRGDIEVLNLGNLAAWKRWWQGEEYLVLANPSLEEVKIDGNQCEGYYIDLLKGDKVKIDKYFLLQSQMGLILKKLETY